MRISFIGAGVMAESLIQGILRESVAEPGDMLVSDKLPERRLVLSQRFGVGRAASNREAMDGADVLVLSVKPQNLAEVLGELRGELAEQLVLSIVAGARVDTLTEGLRHRRVVRAMPNMPAQIGQGMSVWTATQSVEESQKADARRILAALGRELYVADEKYLDMATALSGSGPGYVFLIIEALIDAGVQIGMSRAMAEELVLQTVVGSALIMQHSGRHPAELRNMVTSPGGTTAAGLLELERGGVRAVLTEAVVAAYERAKALGRAESK